MTTAVDTEIRSRLEQLGQDMDTVRRIPVGSIQPGRFQPRKLFDSGKLAELAESIRVTGQLEPGILNKLPDGSYELIAGERRWRACKIADRKTFRAVVVEITDTKLLMQLSLLSNDREELTDQELLDACIRMRDELQMTHDEIAAAHGKTVGWVSNLFAMERLHGSLRKQLGIDGGFTRSVGIELVRLAVGEQRRALSKVREGRVSQDRARRVVDAMLADGATPHPEAQQRTAVTELFEAMVMGSVRGAQRAIQALKSSNRSSKIRRMDGSSADNLRTELENLERLARELRESVGTELSA